MSEVAPIGERIRKMRALGLHPGMTQAELASAIDVSRETVSAWENGKQVPGRDNLEKLATVLGVTSHWLREGDRGGTGFDPLEPAQTTSSQALVIAWWKLGASLMRYDPGNPVAKTLQACADELRESLGLDGPTEEFVDQLHFIGGALYGDAETGMPPAEGNEDSRSHGT